MSTEIHHSPSTVRSHQRRLPDGRVTQVRRHERSAGDAFKTAGVNMAAAVGLATSIFAGALGIIDTTITLLGGILSLAMLIVGAGNNRMTHRTKNRPMPSYAPARTVGARRHARTVARTAKPAAKRKTASRRPSPKLAKRVAAHATRRDGVRHKPARSWK